MVMVEHILKKNQKIHGKDKFHNNFFRIEANDLIMCEILLCWIY